MMITGIITAIAGVVETIMKLVDKITPAPVLPPPPMAMEKSIRGLEEIVGKQLPDSGFYLGGTELIIIGAILIIISIYLNRTR
jgi:hypothetical protein